MKLVLGLLPALLLGQSNWTMPPATTALGYTMKTMHEDCKSEACVVLISSAGQAGEGSVMESLDPAEVRGRRLRLRAWVRLERSGDGDRAQLWLRVERPSHVLGFYDAMGDRPITSASWRSYEIVGEVAADAEAVSIGLRSTGKARVWIDGVSLERLPAAGPETEAVREAIARIYAGVDAAYDAGDVDAIAARAAPDAAVEMGEQKLPLSQVLASVRQQIAKGAKFHSVSAVTAIRVTGAEAVVWVNNESTVWMVDTPRTVLSVNRDVWINFGDAWTLRQSTLVAANVPR
jgi:hypothetical protein